MLTVLILVLIYLGVVAINITLILWIILSSDDMLPHVNNNAYTFFMVFCPITNILSTLILVLCISNMWLIEYTKWLNK